MPIANQGWAYVSGSGASATSPGGVDTNIQFNNNGAFSGSNLLTTNGSGSLSASVNISASAFYGDGSNITGLTASAVNVADGPAQAIQFRVDTPVSGEISGSSKFMFMTASNTVKLDGASLHVSGASLQISGTTGPLFQATNAGGSVLFVTSSGRVGIGTDAPGLGGSSDTLLDVQGHITIGKSGTAYIFSNNDSDTYMKLGGSTPPGTDGMQFFVGGKRLLMLDENGIDRIVIGSGSSDQTIVSGSLIVSGNLETCFGTASIAHLSGCSPIQVHAPMSSSQPISASTFWGNAAGLTNISLINLDAAGSDTNIQFNQNNEFAADAGLAWDGTSSMTVSSSAWAPTATTYAGSPATSSNGGRIKLLGPSSSTAAYLGTDNLYVSIEGTPMNISRLQIVNDGGMVNLSSSMDVTVNNYADGEQYFEVNTNVASFTLYTGSLGSDDLEYVWSINSGHAGPEDESAWVKLDVSGNTKNFTVGGRDNIQLIANAGLQVDNAASTFNSVSNFNAQLNVNNTSSFGGPATFNNHSASFNRGVNIGGEAGHQMLVNVTGNFNNITNFGNTAIFNSNVTLGDASADGITWNAGSVTQTANALTWKVLSGSAATGSGPTQNGAILFFSSGSSGTKDLLKFHTSGAAPGTVFPQSVYLTQAGALSGAIAGAGSFLALDSGNKVVIATPAGGGGGIFTEINGTSAATTSSIAVGTSGAPQATLQVSSSGNQALLAVAGATNGTVLFLSGSSHMGLGTSTRYGATSTTGSQTTLTINKSANISIPTPGREAFAGLHFEPSLAADGNSMGITFGANISTHANKTLSGIWSNADSSKGNSLLFGTSNSYGTGAQIRMVIGTGGNVGIGTTSPETALEVHYTGSGNPVGLGDDKGGGDVVYFGTGSANLTLGALYYLNSAGGWESADAALTGSGHNQLMGIALGTDPRSDGVLVKGYFHADSFFSGSFIKGGPVYIQSSSVGRTPTGGGYFSASAPTAADSYVRVMGYGTDTANVIYFNPDSTYVEIG